MSSSNGHRRTKLIRESDLVAEVDVELSGFNEPWGPHLDLADARKLDDVRRALQRGDLTEAQRWARVYRIVPLSAAQTLKESAP